MGGGSLRLKCDCIPLLKKQVSNLQLLTWLMPCPWLRLLQQDPHAMEPERLKGFLESVIGGEETGVGRMHVFLDLRAAKLQVNSRLAQGL